jgi:hypothetical protein
LAKKKKLLLYKKSFRKAMAGNLQNRRTTFSLPRKKMTTGEVKKRQKILRGLGNPPK